MREIKPGDPVVFSAKFLTFIRASATDPMWKAKGMVLKAEKLPGGPQYLRVLWNDRDESTVLSTNVVYVGKDMTDGERALLAKQ